MEQVGSLSNVNVDAGTDRLASLGMSRVPLNLRRQ